MRNSSRLNTLYCGNKNIPYARKYRKPTQKYHLPSISEETQIQQISMPPNRTETQGMQEASMSSMPSMSPRASTSGLSTSSIQTQSTSSAESESSDNSDPDENDYDHRYSTSLSIENTESEPAIPTSDCELESSIEFSDNVSDQDNDAFMDNDSVDENEEGYNININDLLHPHLTVTKSEVMIMLMQVFMRHNLSNSALEDILQLINVIVGCAALPSNFYSFSKHFASKEYTRHYICKSCGLYFDQSKEEICRVCNISSKDYFISFDLGSSLKNVLLNNWDQIKRYKASLSNNTLDDILQGEVAQRMKGEDNIFISFNTDGVAVFNSNIKKSLWPILVTINILPPALRFLRRNMIVAGLWLSKNEIDLDVFLNPFLKQLQVLANDGLNLFDGTTCRVLAICCCVDSVARCKLQQLKQFNGYEACSFCMHPGNLTDNKQIRYKFVNAPKRTHNDTIKAMDLCIKRGAPVSGVKGISCLLLIPDFDVIHNCPVDYMHAVNLGVVKQMCNLWFERSGSEFYIKKYIEIVDNILNSINSFQECSRSPRKVSDRKSWKANEWQNWLLIYSSACLKDILPRKYYDHYRLLVKATERLLCTNLTDNDIDECEEKINLFVKDFEKLYGIDEMKYNVHLLTHLCSCVRSFGPLWAFSLFCYEDMNGVLKRYIKSPNQPIIQIANRCAMASQQYNVNTNALRNKQVRAFCETLNRSNKNKIRCLNKNFTINEKVISSYPQLLLEERNILVKNKYTFKSNNPSFDEAPKACDSYFTIEIDDEIIFGVIKNILCDNIDYYLLYKVLDVENDSHGLIIGVETDVEKLVKVNNSLEKCVKIVINGKMYLQKLKYAPWVD